jgi:hypothetical protein
MLINLLIGKASASKLNKNKTKVVWLGAWNDRKDNHRFYFSNKDKCLDFHKFNTFSNFT